MSITEIRKELDPNENAGNIRQIANSLVIKGNSLDVIRRIPPHSIGLILTDPPYHVTKKKNISGDTDFLDDDAYLVWLKEFFKEWRRILRPNGSVYCFCSPIIAARIEVLLGEYFNILSHIVWTKPNAPGYDGWKGKMKKEALRQWYPHSERIIFAEPKYEGNLFNVEFANVIRKTRKQAGLSQHELTFRIGAYGQVNHGGAVSNWEAGRNTPSREQYEKLRMALLETGKVDNMPEYEAVIRPFNVDKTKQYTDIWNFESVRQYRGKHPAEKPVDMLCHMIDSASYQNDIVLDCFAGSGNTGIAALKMNRKAILIEIEQKWFLRIVGKIENPVKELSLFG